MNGTYPKPWQMLADADPDVFAVLEKEFNRQRQGLELIASENFASSAVIAAMANPAANKYAEGLPGKRYYGGCEHVDTLESLAVSRVCELFGSRFANVQPHSGAQANTAVFTALLKPGDTILGLDLSHGGHLSHGSPVNFSGLFFDAHFYGLDPHTERLNYDAIAEQAQKIKPKMVIAGASAYAREIDFKRFREIADQVGAYLLVDMAHIAGLVAAGVHPSPLPHADVVTSTTHKTLRGPRGGIILWNREDLKINKAVFPGTQGGPLEHVIAAKAVCFKEAMTPEFKAYQQAVVDNCRALSEGLVVAGFKLVSGGSDNHLALVDLGTDGMNGKELEHALGEAQITVNKNTVPNETRSPFVTSGIRVGTPAVTTRGMGSEQMKDIAGMIHTVFEAGGRSEVTASVGKQVLAMCDSYPLYSEWGS